MARGIQKDIHGVLLVNKPKGLTSNACLQKIKWIYQAKKAGHTGSLDPLATGMLPICFGEATKFSQYMLDSDKVYEARGQLGVQTDTGDALGKITKQCSSFKITENDLLKTISNFVGIVEQTPSVFSALKYQGKPLYHYARKGISVPLKSREIKIHSIELKRFDGIFFELLVHCSKGTYIRNLVEDIGNSLGVGAHITHLHRVYVAGFERQMMYSLVDLNRKPLNSLDNCLLPLDHILCNFAAIYLSNDEAISLRQGKKIQLPQSLKLHISDLSSETDVIPIVEQSTLSQFSPGKFLENNNLSEEHQSLPTEIPLRLYEKETSQFIGLGVIESPNLLKVKRLTSRET